MRFEAVFDALAPASPYEAPQKRSRELAQEHPLSVYLNETPVYRMVCTPTLLPELVLGRLLTEGVIDSVSEVQTLRFCNQGLRARVFLNHPLDLQTGAEPIPSCCTGNRTLTQLASDGYFPQKLPAHHILQGSVLHLPENGFPLPLRLLRLRFLLSTRNL